MTMRWILVLPLFFLSCSTLAYRQIPWGQTPAMPPNDDTLPTVGISLAFNHGTISTRLPDGSFVDIAHVAAEWPYIETMKRLSSPGARHPSPPYSSSEAYWSDVPRQTLRAARKKIGLPASSDVRHIGKLLKALLHEASQHDAITPASLKAAVISYPPLVALYTEDIADAASYIGVRPLTGQFFYQPREITAAYAGHGMGLCASYTDREKCTDEGRAMTSRHTLFVEWTEGTILLQYKIMREAVDLAEPDISACVDFISDQDGKRASEAASFFTKTFLELRFKLLGLPDEILVILTGRDDNSDDAKTIEDAVGGVVKKVEMRTSNPRFVASRGASELAFRAKSFE